ncbi:cytosine permease [Jonesiaceae bacterium BS-20]|uniref:Cytosine permease n=1 Tax=Jonesiaceae bacterium BS-20 TaxID=3120821 RepID=A0AAU7DYQ1_9MICO
MTTSEKFSKDPETVAMDNEEHMLTPVPLTDKRSTWGLAAIWVGFGFVVTGLIVGGQLAGQGGTPGMSFAPAMLTITIGELILFGLTILIGIPAMKSGYNLALLAKASYGTKGFILPMVVMALLTLGWFASILGMIGDIWGALFGNPSGITVIPAGAFGTDGTAAMTLEIVLSCLVFGALFTYTAYRGISAIEKVATPIAPFVLVVALGVGIAMVVQNGGWNAMLETASTVDGMSMGTGLTIVVGAWIAGAIMGADIMRFAKNTKAVVICAAACFILTNPLLNVVGYVGSITTGDSNFVNWMYIQGIFLAIIGVVVWTTSLWTTNNSELYSNSLYAGPSLNAMSIKVKRTKLVLIAGIIGTILGSLGFYQLFFADFITVLGAAFVPLAAPIIVDFFILNKGKYTPDQYLKQPTIKWPGFLAFLIGAGSGLFFQYVTPLPGGFSSGIAALIIAIIAHLILVAVLPKQVSARA